MVQRDDSLICDEKNSPKTVYFWYGMLQQRRQYFVVFVPILDYESPKHHHTKFHLNLSGFSELFI